MKEKCFRSIHPCIFLPSLSSSGHHTLLSPDHERRSHCTAFHSGLLLPNRRCRLSRNGKRVIGSVCIWCAGVWGRSHGSNWGSFFFGGGATRRVGSLVFRRAWLEKPHISTRGYYKHSSAWNAVFPPLLFYCSLSLFFFFYTSCPFQSLCGSSMWPLCTLLVHFLLELMPFLFGFCGQSWKQMWMPDRRAFIHNAHTLHPFDLIFI